MVDFNGVSIQSLLNNANIGIVIHRWDTSIVYANPTALKLLRLSHEQIIGKDALDPQWRFVDEGNMPIQHEDFPVSKVKRFQSPLNNEVLGVIDSSSIHPTWFLVNAYPEMAEDIDNSFIVVTFNDISQQIAHFSFGEIVDNAKDVIIVTEAKNIERPLGPKIVYVNKAFEQLTGYKKEEVIGETPRILQGKDTDKAELAKIRQALLEKQQVTATLLNYSKTGHPYWLKLDIFPLLNRNGEATHFAALERDVTSEKYYAEQLEIKNQNLKEIKENLEHIVHNKTVELHDLNKQLHNLAYYDGLTHIPNRRSFLDLAEQQLSRARRTPYWVMTGIIDIDHFKKFNDQYGHHFGDQVLIAVSNCISSFFRNEDAYGRYGGEEFAFCILLSDEAKGRQICERLREKVEQKDVETEQQTSVSVTVSIGAVIQKLNDNSTLESAMKIADKHLYIAKNNGRNCVEIGFEQD